LKSVDISDCPSRTKFLGAPLLWWATFSKLSYASQAKPVVPNLFSVTDPSDDLAESCRPLKPVNTVM